MSRQYEAKIEIAAPPEEVWRVLSEAEGVQSWFAPTIRVEPGEGGSMTIAWAPGMEGTSKIDVWKPGEALRYSYERPKGEPNVTDWRIESSDGAHTTLRLVNSGFGEDASFDGELESSSHAWPLFLLLLKESAERQYKKCVNVTVFTMPKVAQPEAWKQITAPGIEGKVLHLDPHGNGCWETPGKLTSIFCEKCGATDTMLTIMCFLYDPADGAEAATRAEAETLAARIA